MHDYSGDHDEKYYAYDQGLPCRNRHCKSHGRPHPNCHCYSAMGSDSYAQGGEVKNHCASLMPHKSDCQYFADGGEVKATPPINPGATLAHAAVHHGFLGLVKNAGRGSMSDPDKHYKILHEAKDQHHHRKNPTGVSLKKSLGNRLGDHIHDGKHEDAAAILHGHPISGSANKSNLKNILEHLGPSMMSSEPNPEALRGSVQYLDNAIGGHDILHSETKRIFDKQKKSDRIKPNEQSREALKKFLDEIRKNPESLLEVGGSLDHYTPEHAAQIGALAASGVQYLDSIRPKTIKPGPLDEEIEPEKMEMERWNRHLDIAEKPTLVLQHAADGILESQDLVTLNTLYPALMDSIKDKLGEELINAEADGKKIPYKSRLSLSMILESPVDSTMTTESMQAIMKANAGARQNSQMEKQKRAQGHATSAELKQISKVDSLYETPLESRLINKKE